MRLTKVGYDLDMVSFSSIQNLKSLLSKTGSCLASDYLNTSEQEPRAKPQRAQGNIMEKDEDERTNRTGDNPAPRGTTEKAHKTECFFLCYLRWLLFERSLLRRRKQNEGNSFSKK
jgi:hypothetical protein